MHSLTIVFGPNGTMINFLYEKEEDAEKMMNSIFASTGHLIGLKDDYGQVASLVTSSIHGAFLEDLVKSGDARIARQIQNTKDNVKLNNKAASDPTLKLAMNNGMNHPGAPRRPLMG